MSDEQDTKQFKITPNDLFKFYIKGLNGIGEYEYTLIKTALRRSYMIGYSQGRTAGEKRIRETIKNIKQ